ncbi:MAG: hypothetical protein FWC85_02195, partial [Elusimicrobia bacterium]|nr:hypothetical protein [Elusimicrobiota bacterium]
WMDWNVNYLVRFRTARNSFALADTGGTETSRILFDNYMSFFNLANMSVRNFVAYDFTNSSRPWQPLVTEVMAVPSSRFSLYLRYVQSLNPNKFSSFQMDSRIGNLERAYLNLGVFYQDFLPGEINFVTGVGMWLTPKWRVDYLVRFRQSLSTSFMSTNDQEVRIYRDLHCFNLGVAARFRGGYGDVFFRFNMKTNMPLFARQDDIVDHWFYPWR